MKKIDLDRWFASVQPYLETSDGQHTLTMCHFPMVTWNHQSRSYMIHGHIHENTDMDYWPLLVARERVLNAGCDINNFEPVSFQELVENIVFLPNYLCLVFALLQRKWDSLSS